MMAREKQLGFDEREPRSGHGSWFAGVMIGVTVSNLATTAIVLGTSAAIARALAGKPPPGRRPQPRLY